MYINVERKGNSVLVRGWDKQKGYFEEKHKFKPTMFINSPVETGFESLDGQALRPRTFEKMSDYYDWKKDHSGIDNFKIFGNDNFVAQFLHEHYKNPDYDLSVIKSAFLDIEVESEDGFPHPEEAKEKVNAITFYMSHDDTYYVFGFGEFDASKYKELDGLTIKYFNCTDERDLLMQFIEQWQIAAPHVVTGWNTEMFDIPYLVNRIAKLLGPSTANNLSMMNGLKARMKKVNFGKEKLCYDVSGIEQLDYIDLYKKYTYTKQESYRLDHIAYVELKDRKLDYSEYGNMRNLYKKNYGLFLAYNIKDVEIVKRLEDKMKLLELVFTLAYYAGVTYSDTFSPVRTWDVIITNYLRERNVIVPPKADHSKTQKFEGAFVKAPLTGAHDWVVSFDLNSLYPHLIMQYNLGPDTLREDLYEDTTINKLLEKAIDTSLAKREGCSMAANGTFYSNDHQSFLSVMMEQLYKERKINKKIMLIKEQELVLIKDEIKRRGL